jgi:hypothetical protein
MVHTRGRPCVFHEVKERIIIVPNVQAWYRINLCQLRVSRGSTCKRLGLTSLFLASHLSSPPLPDKSVQTTSTFVSILDHEKASCKKGTDSQRSLHARILGYLILAGSSDQAARVNVARRGRFLRLQRTHFGSRKDVPGSAHRPMDAALSFLAVFFFLRPRSESQPLDGPKAQRCTVLLVPHLHLLTLLVRALHFRD